MSVNVADAEMFEADIVEVDPDLNFDISMFEGGPEK